MKSHTINPKSLLHSTLLLGGAMLCAAACTASAITVTTANGVGADRGVVECNYTIGTPGTTNALDAASSGTAGDLNGRWVSASPFTNHINEFIALRFDLTGYSLPAHTNFQIEIINHRANTARILHYYGVSNGVSGGNNNGTVTNWTDDDWSETSSALKWSTMPGLHFDGVSSTKGASNTVDLGSATMNSTAKGSSVTFSSAALNTFIRNHPNSVVTILIGLDTSSTGQSRFASKEATALDAGSPTGAAGDFAPRLNFVPSCQTAAVTTDPTNKTVSVSQTAQFSLVVAGSPTYQWEISTNTGTSWNALANATNASYTTPAVTTNDSGSQFRCLVNVACDSSSATSAVATLTVTVPNNLVWVGDGTANLWDTSTANWTGDATVFTPNDNVRFDDSGNNAVAIDLVDTVAPSLIVVSNVTKDYVIGTTATGTLGGAASLTKSGAGKLTLTTVNSFTGKTTVNGGTLSIDNASKLGATPGSFTADQLTLDAGTLEFTGSISINANRGTTLGASGGTYDIPTGINYTNTPPITGPGGLTKVGAGTLNLPPTNTYAGGTVISNGTVIISTYGSLGAGPLTLAGGTFLVVPTGGATTGVSNAVTVAQNSMLQYSGGNSFACVIFGPLTGTPGATLTVNSTASSTFNRLRLYGNFTNSVNLDLSVTKVQLAPYNAAGSQAYNGVISGPGLITQRGNGGITLNNTNTFTGGTIFSQGSVGVGADSVYDAGILVGSPLGVGAAVLGQETGLNGSSTLYASGGARTIGNAFNYDNSTNGFTWVIAGTNDLTLTGPVTLHGQVDAAGGVNRPIQVDNTGKTTFDGPIDDNALNCGLTKTGAGLLLLNGTNTYAGMTTVSNGTLGGNGIIGGGLNVASGASLAPGASAIGTLTVNNGATLSGNVVIEINKSGPQTNDFVLVSGGLSGGASTTVTVTNLGPALVAGNSFKLFSAPMTGGASAIITPAPGVGLAWTNKLAVDGSIAVVTAAPSIPTNPTNITFSVSGGNLNLLWPSDHTGWSLQAQTNTRAVGLNTNWFTLPGYETTNGASLNISPSSPTVFYRLFYLIP